MSYESKDQPQNEVAMEKRESSLDEEITRLKANQADLERRISELESSMRKVHLKIWGEQY